MSLSQLLSAWQEAQHHENGAELLLVDFDSQQIRLRRPAPAGTCADIKRHFSWAAITRVCFRDGGIYQSDLIVLELAGQEPPVLIPLRAQGGPAFFAQLVGRQLLPENLVKAALGGANGGLYCWPPYGSENA